MEMPAPAPLPVASGGARILIADGDGAARALFSAWLRSEGHAPESAASEIEAVAMTAQGSFDLVVLDALLSEGCGFAACRAIRASSAVPVLFVSTAGTLADRVRGFDAGADGYVVKPVHGAELIRRVRALLWRSRGSPVADREVPLSGPEGLVMRPAARTVTVGGQPVGLTRTEFALLRLLLERHDVVQRFDALTTAVWGYETAGDRNFVQQHLSRLRRKLARAGAQGVISTVHGVGYVVRQSRAA